MRDAEYITFAQAQQRYGVPMNTLRYWRSAGRLSKYRRNDQYHTILLDVSEVDALVEAWRALRAHLHDGEVIVDG